MMSGHDFGTARPSREQHMKPISIKPANKGKLHSELGVPQGKKIPAGKMAAAKKDASPAEKKRIVFAQNAAKWNKK
jgi:hypothetical protein